MIKQRRARETYGESDADLPFLVLSGAKVLRKLGVDVEVVALALENGARGAQKSTICHIK
jgi:hypothetical protein